MQKQSNTYIYLFSVIVCIFVSIFVALSSILLKPRQKTEARLDVVKNILSVSGLPEEELQSLKQQEMLSRFENGFQPLFLNKSNETVDRTEIEKRLLSLGYPQKELSSLYPFELINTFNAKLNILASRAGQKPDEYNPGYKLIFLSYKEEDSEKTKPSQYIIPIDGYGLWGMMFGYLALAPDLNTITGIRFYSHQETPGLGGEAEKPWFTGQFVDKKILSPQGELKSVSVVKGKAADLYSGEELKHRVDGISGATITGDAISAFLKEDLNTFEPYFNTVRSAEGTEGDAP